MDAPTYAVADRAWLHHVEGQPPKVQVRPEHLLKISPCANVELWPLPVFPLEILDGSVILPDQSDMEPDEICQRPSEKERHQKPQNDDDIRERDYILVMAEEGFVHPVTKIVTTSNQIYGKREVDVDE